LSLLQQKGTENNPDTYVTFQTPNTAYNGYQSFFLPSNVSPSKINAMALEVNYKTPGPSVQVWTISIYDWKSKKWFQIGATNVDSSKEWRKQVLILPYQARYFSSTGEIRILLKSNNAAGDALLDYEAIQISVAGAPTAIPATPTQVNTSVPATNTPNPTPTYTSTP
jgi:hypothetical protein